MFSERLFRELGRQKVKYLVVGGVAVNLHGYNRLTGDLDIVLLLKDANLRKFISVVKKLGLKPQIPVKLEDFSDQDKRDDWIRNKNMKAFKLYGVENPAEHLDVVIDSGIDFDRAYPNRSVIKAGDLRIPLIGIDDLIHMKKKAGRRKDEIDIEALTRIKELQHD